MLFAQEWIFGQIGCQLFYATTSLNWFSSVFTLTVLSADRYAAVCHAVMSTNYRTQKLALSVSAVIWLLSLVVVTPVYLYAKTVCYGRVEICQTRDLYWSVKIGGHIVNRRRDWLKDMDEDCAPHISVYTSALCRCTRTSLRLMSKSI